MSKGDPLALGDPADPAFRVGAYPFFQLNRVAAGYNARMAHALKAAGIDVPSWRVLMVLAEASPQSLGELARATLVKLPTIQRTAQRMAQTGLIALRQRTSDGRVTEATLEAAGRDALANARQAAGPVYRGLVQGFRSADMSELLRLLAVIQTNLEDARGYDKDA